MITNVTARDKEYKSPTFYRRNIKVLTYIVDNPTKRESRLFNWHLNEARLRRARTVNINETFGNNTKVVGKCIDITTSVQMVAMGDVVRDRNGQYLHGLFRYIVEVERIFVDVTVTTI